MLCADFSNKQLRKERPEDLDVPIALADFIHQIRTQEHMEDMLALHHIWMSCGFLNIFSNESSIPSDIMVSFRFSHPYQYELDHIVMPESLKSKPQPQVAIQLIVRNLPHSLIFLPN